MPESTLGDRLVLTVIGIDAATKPKNMGLARGRIDGGTLVVDEVRLGSEVPSVPSAIASWIRGPALIAVDAPLGWPAPMGIALAGHRAGQVVPHHGDQLFARLTDRIVHETVKKKPLDVGADRIARTAVAALRLVQDVRDATRLPIPLSWTPGDTDVGVVEVYPAATLIGRRLSTAGYKKDDADGRAARGRLVDALARELTLPQREPLLATDHALDAVLCLVAAVDYVRGDVVPPPAAQLEQVRTEGWIWFKARQGPVHEGHEERG